MGLSPPHLTSQLNEIRTGTDSLISPMRKSFVLETSPALSGFVAALPWSYDNTFPQPRLWLIFEKKIVFKQAPFNRKTNLLRAAQPLTDGILCGLAPTFWLSNTESDRSLDSMQNNKVECTQFTFCSISAEMEETLSFASPTGTTWLHKLRLKILRS